MKEFTTMAAQGDFVITKIDALPEGLKQVSIENGKLVVAHSETGHHHVMEATRGVTAYEKADKDIFTMFLKVDAPTPIEHLRSFHTHEGLMVQPGIYRINRQRQATPTGWVPARD